MMKDVIHRQPSLDVILEIQSSITVCDSSLVFHLSSFNFCLHSIQTPDIKDLAYNQKLRETQRTQREAVSQFVGSSSIDLPCNDPRRIAHGLLEADLCCSSVMWGDIDIEPG